MTSRGEFRMVVLASGGGTNLQAIIDRLHGRDGTVVAGVGSDQSDAFALQRARDAGIENRTFPSGAYPSRDARDAEMAAWIESLQADLVVLAGYMQLLSAGFVDRFRNRIVNVHPALLPSFPGLDAIGQAIRHGVRVTGVTVHFVDEGTDTGPIISQRPVEMPADFSRETVEEEIHRVEHEIYPEAIGLIAEGRIRIAEGDSRQVTVLPAGTLPEKTATPQEQG